MTIITFDEWKKECGNDEKKAKEYQNEHFNGENQFEITFRQWAEFSYLKSEKIKLNEYGENFKNYVLPFSGGFSIIDINKGTDILNDNILQQKDFKKEFCQSEDGVYNKIDLTENYFYEKQDRTYILKGLYTILLLWWAKKKNNVISEEERKYLQTGSSNKSFIKIDNKSFHTGINSVSLAPRVSYLIQNLFMDICDNYKIVFIPNKNKNSENDNNGGNNKMSVNDNNQDVEINEYIGKKIDAHKQIIFTGAPGTGKTYSVREYVKRATRNDESRYKFVQFHSSYDYTDFVEGIRPAPKGNGTTNNSGENMFVRMDGTFKAFCRKIVNANIEILKDNKVLTETEINDIYYKNESKSDTKEKMKSISDSIKEKIEKEEIPMYYFVIDEINRADLSKVFGELMFGLEEDYRGVQNRFPTQYSNLPTYEMKEDKAVIIEKDCFKNGFFVPENLTIIGTMNDIDRSVETFDFALRRRFAWVEIKANAVMRSSVAAINGIEEDEIDDDFDKIINRIKAMNNIICGDLGKKLGLNESYHIGPAYFKNLFDGNGKDNRDTIFNEKIEPLLREYTRGRDSQTVINFIKACNDALLGKSKTTDTSGGNNG